jgi:hypothetical protein
MAHNERQRVCSLKKLWAASASASASFPCHVIVDRQARRDGLAFFAYKMMNPLLKIQEDAESNKDQRTKQWHQKLVGKTLVEDGKETDLADHQVSIRFLL